MPATIKSFRFEGSELVVDLELRITFGIDAALPAPALQEKAVSYVDAKREAKKAYQRAWNAKRAAAKTGNDFVSDEKLAKMQALQDKINKLQGELKNAVPKGT